MSNSGTNCEKKTLGDYCQLRMGSTVISHELDSFGTPVFSADTGDEPWGHLRQPRKVFKKGAIVIGARGSIGNPRMPETPVFVATQTTIVAEPINPLELDNEYLLHWLRCLDFASISAQQAIPMLTVSALAETPIEPPSLDKQRKISRLLAEVDAQIRLVAECFAKTVKLRAGLFKDKLQGDFPLAKVADVANVVTGRTPPTSSAGNFGGPVLFATPGDLFDTDLNETQRTLSDKGASFVPRAPANSTLISCIGALLGKTAFVNHAVAFNQQVNALVPREHIHPRFLFYWAQQLKPSMNLVAGLQAIPIVNKSTLSKIALPFPRDARIQKDIVDLLSSLDAELELLTTEIQKLEKRRTGLMQALIQGPKLSN